MVRWVSTDEAATPGRIELPTTQLRRLPLYPLSYGVVLRIIAVVRRSYFTDTADLRYV